VILWPAIRLAFQPRLVQH